MSKLIELILTSCLQQIMKQHFWYMIENGAIFFVFFLFIVNMKLYQLHIAMEIV